MSTIFYNPALPAHYHTDTGIHIVLYADASDAKEIGLENFNVAGLKYIFPIQVNNYAHQMQRNCASLPYYHEIPWLH